MATEARKDVGAKWVAGPNFVLVRRGSSLGRAGGAHSGGAGRRHTRGFIKLMGKLGENVALAAKSKGMTHNQFIAAVRNG